MGSGRREPTLREVRDLTTRVAALEHEVGILRGTA